MATTRDKRNLKLVRQISSEEFLTSKQLETLINSSRYYEIIEGILEERQAEIKCRFLMCKNASRFNDRKLAATYKLSNNKLFTNEQRKFYCSEICFNLWTGIEKQVTILKPSDQVESKMVAGVMKPKKKDRVHLRNMEIFQEVLKFQKVQESENANENLPEKSTINTNTLTQPMIDEIKFIDKLDVREVAPDLDRVSVSSSENNSINNITFDDEKDRLITDFAKFGLDSFCFSGGKKRGHAETSPVVDPKQQPYDLLTDFRNLFTTWLTARMDLDFEKKEVSLEKMVMQTQGTGRYVVLPTYTPTSDSCVSTSENEPGLEDFETRLKRKKKLQKKRAKTGSKKGANKDASDDIVPDISERPTKTDIVPNLPSSSESTESVLNYRIRIFAQQVDRCFRKSTVLDKYAIPKLHEHSLKVVSKFFNFNSRNCTIPVKFKDLAALFFMACGQVFLEWGKEEVRGYLNEECKSIVDSDFYGELAGEVHNLYEKMVFGIR